MRPSPGCQIACITALLWLAALPLPAQELVCNPCNHGFGKVQVGNTSSFTFTLTNTGTRVVRISSDSETGSEFSFGSFKLPLRIKPGISVELTATFEPTAKGYSTGELTLNSNAFDSPLTLRLHGQGISTAQANLTITPCSLSFGKVVVGTNQDLPAILAASGAAVTITSDGSTSSEFAIVGLTLPVTIPAGENLNVTLQFTPNQSGKASGNVGFTSNAVDSPTVAELSGTGVPPPTHSVSLSWQPGSQGIVGYNIYRSTSQGGPFSGINTALDASTTYTDYSVAAGSTYFYVTTEVDAEGQESGYSNEAEAVIPSP